MCVQSVSACYNTEYDALLLLLKWFAWNRTHTKAIEFELIAGFGGYLLLDVMEPQYEREYILQA